MRTLVQDVRVRARSCGDLLKSSWGNILISTGLVVKHKTVKTLQNTVNILKEEDDEVIHGNLVKKAQKD